MSYQITGNTDPRLGGVGLRKPDEGEFKAVLPGSGLPLPFKEQDESLTLTVSDGFQGVYSEPVVLIQEHDLASADSGLSIIAEAVVLVQEHAPALSDSVVQIVGDAIELSQEHYNTISDASVATIGESISLSEENSISITDAVVKSVGESITIEQENVLVVADSVSQTSSEYLSLEIENVLSVSDAAINCVAEDIVVSETKEAIASIDDSNVAVAAETVSLLVSGIVQVAHKPRMRRPRVYYTIPEPEEEKIVYTLDVYDGFVKQNTEKVDIVETTLLKVFVDSKIKNTSNVIGLEYQRSKRRKQEDIILLMAA